ncbi:MAG: hypothetical protein NW241_20525 [Bacteroidia bacterium]|nr:hypothetical protein [Bacteroidia bacterium]
MRTLRTLLFCCLGLNAALAQPVQPLSALNSACEEREPTLSPDGQWLYFWRRECPDNTAGSTDPGDIWVSRRISPGQWGSPSRLPYPLNTAGHEFVWQVSRMGDTLWLCQTPTGSAEAGLAYATRRRDGAWNAPQRVSIRGFRAAGDYKDFYLGPGRILLLTWERDAGFGGSDLYLCRKLNDTAWAAPVNLGAVLNTPGDEDAPFLSPDGRYLYFSSNGHGGEGDHDLFVSQRLDDTWLNWSLPQPLGAPFNTRGYDFDLFLAPDGLSGYWASAWNSRGLTDLFTLDWSACRPQIWPEGDVFLCQGESQVLEAGFRPGAYSFQWLKDGQRLPAETGRSLTLREAGSYRVIRYGAGCADTSAACLVRLVPRPYAEIRAEGRGLCLEDSVRLQATGGARSYQWLLNGLPIPGAVREVHYARSTGSYTVQIGNGSCTVTSPPVQIRRMAPPDLYAAADSARLGLPVLPRWQWSNKVPPVRGGASLQALAVTPRGAAAALTTELRGTDAIDRVTVFTPQGLVSGSFAEGARTAEGARHLAADPEGHFILSGPGYFLAKYRSDGTLLWKLPEPLQPLTGLACDPAGNILVTGRFADSLRLGSQRFAAPGRGGLFIAKYAGRGDLLWVKVFPVDGAKYAFRSALHCDRSGNSYLAGGIDVIANFKGEVLRAQPTGENYFLARFSPEGNLVWGRSFRTDPARNKLHAHVADSAGTSWLLLNRELRKVDRSGQTLYQGDLLQPAGETAVAASLAAAGGDLYITGRTDKGHIFVTVLNRANRQTILWTGSAATEGSHTASASDEAGAVYIAAETAEGRLPGEVFDLTSGSRLPVMKYGKPAGFMPRSPVKLCGSEPVLLQTADLEGFAYTWIRNGQPLPGASGAQLAAASPGLYQVRIRQGSCERLSQPLEVTDCNGELPRMQPPQAAQPPASVQPAPVSPPAPSELRISADGTPARLRNRRIKTQVQISVSNPEVSLYVWDHAAQDRDTISINLNGEWILEEYGLQNRKLKLSSQLRRGDNYIMLYAHNLGTTPPNTASITVDDGQRQQTLQLRSTLRNCGMLRVRVE